MSFYTLTLTAAAMGEPYWPEFHGSTPPDAWGMSAACRRMVRRNRKHLHRWATR
jgi:hypothetical protein